MESCELRVPLALSIPGVVVREWREDDVATLVREANNRNVSRQLRDRFPFPYEAAHGAGFVRWAISQAPRTVWAISVDDEAVGGIGVELGRDVERVSAEIGYWLGEPFWRRGIVTSALEMVTPHLLATFGLSRIFALPFTGNAASVRVLEKAGYVREGHLRQCAIKDGVIVDQYLYARYRS